MKKTYLVTGGAGFIGSNLVHWLLDSSPDAQVIVLDKLTYAGHLESLEPASRNPRYEFVRGDIGDRTEVESLFRRIEPDVVFNLAAESHVDRSIEGPAAFVQTNIVGTFVMLDVALHWSRGREKPPTFVHVSTDEVYGSLGAEGRFTEESQYQPNSPYAASKAGADHLARAYFHTYGLPVVTTNCSNNYGPYQFPEKLIPLVTLNAIESKPLPVYGDGLNVRDWLFVRDHCEALHLVAERGEPGETYNIGGNEERTTLDMVRGICRVLDESGPKRTTPHHELIRHVDDRPGHDRRYAIDASKITETLGWRPKTSFDDGLEQTVRWYVENREWCERVAKGVYERERLGLARGEK